MNIYATIMPIELQVGDEFAEKVARLREAFRWNGFEATISIYILKVKPESFSDARAKAKRTFPSQNYPSLIDTPTGYVYVGLTGLSAEDRYAVHQTKEGKASKIAKLGLLADGSYEVVGKELTNLYGFKQVGWTNNKPEKLESWVAWNFYKMGYWVWGSHYHNEENFLGTDPFE